MRGQSRKLRSDMTSNRVGAGAGLYRLATQANMRGFDVFGNWATAQITAADQARFFAQLEELTPARYREYARQLLSSVVRSQAWGIPEVSRPRWKTFFKGGWRETTRGQLAHQVAWLESRRLLVAIAILTDGNPSQAYGRATIRGYCNSPPRRLEPCAVLRSRSVVWARQHREVYK